MVQRKEIFKCRLCGKIYYGDLMIDEEDIEDDLRTIIHDCADGRKGVAVLDGYTAPIQDIEVNYSVKTDDKNYPIVIR